jgi:hypothetical protein
MHRLAAPGRLLPANPLRTCRSPNLTTPIQRIGPYWRSRPETAGGERPVSGIESRPLRSFSGGLLVTAGAVRSAGGQLTVKAVRLPAALRHW